MKHQSIYLAIFSVLTTAFFQLSTINSGEAQVAEQYANIKALETKLARIRAQKVDRSRKIEAYDSARKAANQAVEAADYAASLASEAESKAGNDKIKQNEATEIRAAANAAKKAADTAKEAIKP